MANKKNRQLKLRRLKKLQAQYPEYDIEVLSYVISQYFMRIRDVFKPKFHNTVMPTCTVPHIGTFSAKASRKKRAKAYKKESKKIWEKSYKTKKLKSKEYILF